MKHLFIIALTLLVVACTPYGEVKKQYKSGNPHARDLLLGGYNPRFAAVIDGELVEQALIGNEEAKQIVFAQMEHMSVIHNERSRTMFFPIVLPSAGGRR